MLEPLNQVGEDLAELVLTRNLQTAELDIEHIEAYGLKIFDAILLHLSKVGGFNSLILVSEDVDFANAYINSISLLMYNHNNILSEIETRYARIKSIYPFYQKDNLIKSLVGKRLRTMKVKEFLTIGLEGETWQVTFSSVLEARQMGIYFVIDRLQDLMQAKNRDNDNLTRITREFLFAVKGTKITFLAALSWDDYVQHIERGFSHGFIRYCQPFLFSPRPSHLPETLVSKLSPDMNFEFKKA